MQVSETEKKKSQICLKTRNVVSHVNHIDPHISQECDFPYNMVLLAFGTDGLWTSYDINGAQCFHITPFLHIISQILKAKTCLLQSSI